MSELDKKHINRLYALLKEKEQFNPDAAMTLRWTRNATVPSLFLSARNPELRDLYFAMTDDELFELATDDDFAALTEMDDATFTKAVADTEPIRLAEVLSRLQDIRQET